MAEDDVCLLVQRAGTIKEFPLRGTTIRFGYAPGGEHDLVLYDSLLDDVQGTLEHLDGPQEKGLTRYRLRAKSAGILVDGVPLPPREGVAIQLRLDQSIKVGHHYQLTIAPFAAANGPLVSTASSAPARSVAATVGELPAELQEHLAVSRLFMPYLPEIYRSDEAAGAEAPAFLARFLALFESVFLPLRWTVQNYGLCLHPASAPPELLAWLAEWYGFPSRIDFLPESRQRMLLRRMYDLLERKGTAAGLHDLLQTMVGTLPSIEDEVQAHHFTVEFGVKPEWWEQYQNHVTALIDWYKPAHTTFELR
jgi:phage tail-like protein